jgi:hypothetical protein
MREELLEERVYSFKVNHLLFESLGLFELLKGKISYKMILYIASLILSSRSFLEVSDLKWIDYSFTDEMHLNLLHIIITISSSLYLSDHITNIIKHLRP